MDTHNRLKSLVELTLRTITANLETLDSLGTLPYRLAKPILQQCQPDQLLEIEKSSPHLKDEDQEIWEGLCMKRFDVRKDRDDYEAPKSWRKFYLVSLAREKQMEEDAGNRIRSKYQALQAQKQERSLVFTANNVPPMKRSKANGWGRAPAPKTLFDKARSQTMRKAGVYAAPKATAPAPRPNIIAQSKPGPSGAGKSSSPNAQATSPTIAFPLNSNTPSRITVTTTTIPRPHPSDTSSQTSSNSDSDPRRKLPPPRPPPIRQHTHASPPAASALFMPKHKASSQLPTRAK